MIKKLNEEALKACHAHTDLNTFHAVINLLEGGLLYDPRSNRAANAIIKICKAERQRHLRRYDKAMETL
jgi:hypothetical protein